MNQFEKLQCPMCSSREVHFEKNYSNPIRLDVKACIFILSTVIQKSKQVIKCNKCGYEFNPSIKIKNNKIVIN